MALSNTFADIVPVPRSSLAIADCEAFSSRAKSPCEIPKADLADRIIIEIFSSSSRVSEGLIATHRAIADMKACN